MRLPMPRPTPLRRRAAAGVRLSFMCAYAACFLHISLAMAASAPNTHIDPFERAEYETYPPTVFAPTGRLHMVDSVGMAACNKDDATAGLVVALRCGGSGGRIGSCGDSGNGKGSDKENDSKNEFIVVVGTSARSPLAIQASALMAPKGDDPKEDAGNEEGEETNNEEENEPNFRSALLVNSPERPVPSTLSILSPTLLVATGGTPTDAAVLLDRIQTVASDMHNSNFGGTGFTYQSTPKQGQRFKSGMFGVEGSVLARNVADIVQGTTQSIRSRAGSMLAASAIIVDTKAGEGGGDSQIWRIDPSGQFWSCDAATVGRGAGVAEAFLLKEIARRMKYPADMKGSRGDEEGDDDDDEEEEESDADDLKEAMASLSNQDVKKFLRSLSMNEAIALARDCVLKVYEDELRMCEDGNQSSGADEEKESGFDIRSIISIGGAVLRPSAPTAKIIKF